MKVEIFFTPGCSNCAAAHDQLRATAQEVVESLEWRELSVLEEFDYAVELGVISLPSIAIDGKLVFTSMPTAQQLREALIERAGRSR